MTSHQLPPPPAAEQFSVASIRSYQPLGTPWRRALSYAESFFNRANAEIQQGSSRVPSALMIIHGRFGTGKSLIARKLAISFARTIGYVVPIILPLRRMVEELESNPALRQLKGLEAALAWYVERGFRLVEEDPRLWNGVTITGDKINRLEVLKSIVDSKKPHTLYELVGKLSSEGLITLLIIDESEAIITPRNRDQLAAYELNTLVLEAISNAFTISTGGYDSVLLILTSVFAPYEWVTYTLRMAARTPSDERLRIFLSEVKVVTSEEYRRITEAASEADRIQLAEKIAEHAKHRFPLAKPEVMQRSYIIRLYYTQDDYAEFIEKRLGLKLDTSIKPLLLQFLEAVQLSFRTLIHLASRSRSLGIEVINLDTIGDVITANGVKLNEYEDNVLQAMRICRIPKRTMWPQRLKNMIAIGAIMVADRQKLAMLSDSEWKIYLDMYRRLYERFFGRKPPLLDVEVVNKVVDVINRLYLDYDVIRYYNGYYVVDEYVIRWFLDVPIDEYGQDLPLSEYICEHHEHHRAKYRRR